MPLYDYQDTRTGQTVELWRPIALRDAVPGHLRRLMPDRLMVHAHGRAERDPINFVQDAKKGFALAEDQYGRSLLEHKLGRPLKEIKRIWNNFHESDQPKQRAA